MRRTQGWCYQFSYSMTSECPCRERQDNKNLLNMKNITLKYVKETFTGIVGYYINARLYTVLTWQLSEHIEEFLKR